MDVNEIVELIQENDLVGIVSLVSTKEDNKGIKQRFVVGIGDKEDILLCTKNIMEIVMKPLFPKSYAEAEAKEKECKSKC